MHLPPDLVEVVSRRFRLLRWLSQGSFGSVWEAETTDGRHVALKFLACRNQSDTVQEIKTLHRLNQVVHPHLLRTEEISGCAGYMVIAMPLAEGSLLDLLEAYQLEYRRGIPRFEVCQYLAQVGSVLDFLHQRQHSCNGSRVSFQHCDIKPSNLLLFGETVQLADFGLTVITSSPNSSRVAGGTPDYMAPELFQGRITPWADQYSLAVTYCQLRTGMLPFPPASYTRKYVRPAPNLSQIEPAERPVLSRALDPVPQERWPSCGVLIEKLAAAQTRETHLEIDLGTKEGDRRDWPRYAVSRPFECVLTPTEGPEITARLRDVSLAGVGLVANAVIAEGTGLKLQLDDLPLTLLMRVQYSSPQADSKCFVGCRLMRNLTEPQLRQLTRASWLGHRLSISDRPPVSTG